MEPAREAQLEEVPADLVTSSASGLDPHITLKNALYQLERVAAEWAKKTKGDEKTIRDDIEAMLKTHASPPMFGLVGVEMVNVLEVNLALRNLPILKAATAK